MKKLIIAISTIFFSVLIMISIYTFLPQKHSEQPQQPQIEYIVKDYCGKVAVFENNSKTPLVVYEIYTHLLPESDIEILRRGIKVNSQEQLQHCLEDLGF